MKKLLFAFGLLIWLVLRLMSAHADELEPAPDWYDSTDMRAFRDDRALDAIPQSRPQACSDAYANLFRNENLNVRVFFGYTNDESAPGHKAGDDVYDHFIKQTFVQMLLQPCVGNLAACGFAEDSSSPDVLTKEVTALDGKPRTVRIELEASSVSDSNSENRHMLKSEQKAQSKEIQNDFVESMRDADVVLYLGHARYGTGPGFKPLPTMSLSWIEAGIFKPSWHRMLKALRASEDKPHIIGVYACLTEKYYLKGLSKAAPESALILSNESLEYDDAQESVFGTLNSLLRMDCEDEFGKSLVNTRLFGFFGKGAVPEQAPAPAS